MDTGLYIYIRARKPPPPPPPPPHPTPFIINALSPAHHGTMLGVVSIGGDYSPTGLKDGSGFRIQSFALRA